MCQCSVKDNELGDPCIALGLEKQKGTRDAQMVDRRTGEVLGRVGHPPCDSGHTQGLSGLFGTYMGSQALGCHSAGGCGEWETWLGGRG